jgi:octaprenyl-diphosphate synthase
MQIFQHISDDLDQVHKLIHKNLFIRTSHIKDYVKQDVSYLYNNLRPALVLICHRLFSPTNRQTVALAAVLQFIFMASQVHEKLLEEDTDKNNPTDTRTDCQFPVLVGDFLYGRFFTILCKAGIVHYLRNMAELICTINKNEVTILNNPDLAITNPPAYNDAIRGESAELLACSAYLGADLAGADNLSKDRLYQLGLNLGMAFGLWLRDDPASQINEYVSKAEHILQQLPPGKDKESLQALLGLFTAEKPVLQRMVV